MTAFPTAQRVLDDAVVAKTFPGAIVEVGGRRGPTVVLTSGRLTYEPDAPIVGASTVYDLASLTKVLATTTLAMELVGTARLSLEDPVANWSPAWRAPDRSSVRVSDLLEHASGLPSHRPYYQSLKGRAALETAIAREPLEYAPRSASIYSDAGFILLGFLLERAAGGDLARWFDAWVETEIGAAVALRFLPPSEWRDRVAPTEQDSWRGRLLVGEVHDENAAVLGGVAGHAGLFGTAAGVGSAARWWMQVLAGDVRRGVSAATARQFVRRSSVPGSSRALGWDTMLPTSSCGTRMSRAAIGHTGFTGTSLWIDPERDVYVVFLSNRVHPSRAGDAMKRVRPALHDAIAADLGL
jgi:CubicO group peptidase (beta-lactamase class C family)